MPKSSEYTLEDFKGDVLEVLTADSGENKGEAKKPNLMELLKAQGKLAANKIKR